MSIVPEILAFNESFVKNKQYEQYRTDKFPNKRAVVLTCMDTRLIELLPKALNLKNGDVKFLKNAGAVVSHPFGSVMRSIIVAIYELNAQEVIVIGHHGCGMTGLDPDLLLQKAKKRGISDEVFTTLDHSGIDLEGWLVGFENVEESVINSVQLIRNHPLLPSDVEVTGMVIHPETGQLTLISKEN